MDGRFPAPRFCPNCGALAASGEKFCQQCGMKLEGVAPAPAPVNETPAVPECQAPATPANQTAAISASQAPAAPAYTPPSAPATAIPTAPVYGMPGFPGAVPAAAAPKKKKTGLIITLCSIAALLIAAALVFFLVLSPSSVRLSRSSASVYVGDSLYLTTAIEPGSAVLFTDITWSSSDPSVATVSATGAVTGVHVGDCIITATTGNGKTASCAVTVTNSPYDTAVIGAWNCIDVLDLESFESFAPQDIGETWTFEVSSDHSCKLIRSHEGTIEDDWYFVMIDSAGDYQYYFDDEDIVFYYITDSDEIWLYMDSNTCLTFVK